MTSTLRKYLKLSESLRELKETAERVRMDQEARHAVEVSLQAAEQMASKADVAGDSLEDALREQDKMTTQAIYALMEHVKLRSDLDPTMLDAEVLATEILVTIDMWEAGPVLCF